MRTRRVLDSAKLSELRRKRRRNIRNKSILVFVLLIAIFISLGFVARSSSTSVSAVNISGNNLIETSELEKIVNGILAERYFWLYPKNNIFILPRQDIKKTILTEFKRAEDVSVNINNERVLSIVVNERGAKYTWCGYLLPVVVESSTDKCYFLDEYGYIFDEAPYFSGATYVKFYGGLDNNTPPIGQRISPAYFEKLVYFYNIINQIGLDSSSIVLDEKGEVNVYLSAFSTPPEAPKIILKIDSDIQKLSENLQAAISAESFKKDLKGDYNNLNYIDLRFGNKVYYKFR